MENLGLTFIKNANWNDVLSDWRNREADNWGWEEHWKQRGFESWDDWRKNFYEGPIKLADLEWKLFQINDPFASIPNAWAVAYAGWKQYYSEAVTKIRFKDLVKNPEVRKNKKVASITKDFPTPTTIIGVRWGDELAIFEGMHRSNALAILAEGEERPEIEVNIAITTLAPEERELFYKICTQKSE